MSVKESTARKLFAVSRNQCAFTECREAIYDKSYDSIVGQVAHIRTKKEGGPRFEADYDKVDDYENFDVGIGLDDEAYTYSLVSSEVNSIRWMVPADVMRIGTSGG